jgi:3-oxoacyl-[acyl-carrier protein] reductase
MPARFADRVVVVTGAAGGLGRALAEGFAREGASLVLTDVNAQGLEESAASVRALGSEASTHTLDIADEVAIQAFGADICQRHEQIHVLFNNAGIAYGEINDGFEEVSQAKWLRFLSINSIAPLILAQALRPSLARAKGVIINQSSMAAYVPANPYGVTKACLNAITYGMAQRFSADGIRVNAIAPGVMDTPAARDGLAPGTKERIQSMQLLKLDGTPADIVALALFLASDDARFITREIVHCDAGNQLRGWRG